MAPKKKAKDPLLALLDGEAAPVTTDELLDLIGGNKFVEPKPAAPQGKRPTYREHLQETKDSTSNAHVIMSTELVDRYREYERNPGGKDYRSEYEDVRAVIKEQGIRQPLWISTDGKTAMLVEGNNRVAVAKELGIEELPVRITYDKKTMRNEGFDPVPLDPALKRWIKNNHIEGRYGSDAFDVPELKQYIGMPDEMIDLFHQTDSGAAARIVAAQHLKGRGGPDKGGKYRAATEARKPGWGPEFPVYFTDSPGNSYGEAGVSVRIPVNNAFLDYIDKGTGRRSFAVSQRDLEGVRISPFNPKPLPGPDSGGRLVGHTKATELQGYSAPTTGWPRPTPRRHSRSYANPIERENLKAHSPDLAYRAAVDQVNRQVTEFVRGAYRSNPGFLTNHGEIDRITALVAPAVKAGQLQVAQLTNAHLSALFGLDNVPQPDLKLLQRNGIELEAELARPFWTAIKAAREGKPINEALAAGEYRMERMLETDYQRAKVVQSREALKASGIETYQRIAGPKACWLCSIAATQVYYTKDLLPIHPGCKCDVAPIPPGGQDSLDTKLDPEFVLSKDTSQVKLMTGMVESDAAPAEYRDLVAVREHSEVGPQLTWAHQKFTGPKDLPVPPSRDVLAQQVYDTVRANGGITIDLAGNSPSDGYAYAPYKTTEFKVRESEFTPKHVDDYIDSHHRQLSRKGNNLGMWVQDGYVYLDVSKVGPASAETFAKAQAAHQLAVFDLENFNEINLGTINPTTKEYTRLGTSTDLHRQYRGQVARADESRSAASTPAVPAGAGGSARAATRSLEWTGPPVAPPVRSDAIDHYWQGIDTFDKNKNAIRAGARNAERLGYPGWPLNEYGGREFTNRPKLKDLFAAGGEIVSRAVNGVPTEHPLYRGIQVTPQRLAEVRATKPGQRISMPVSAFSGDPTVAQAFARGNPFMDPGPDAREWRPMGTPKGPLEPLIFQLESGARVADVRAGRGAMLEHLGFGEFEVVSVESKGGTLLDYFDDPPYPVKVKETVVTVRQVSMIEPEAVAPQGGKSRAKGVTKVAGEDVIPEFSFVGGEPKDVTWTGPPVAEPSSNSVFNEYIENHWKTVSFDDYKDEIREGGRDVQRHGYKGVAKEAKEVGLSWADITAGEPGGDKVEPLLRLEGREIVARAVESEPTQETRWRGMTLDDDTFKETIAVAKVGDTLSMPLSSFSHDRRDAFAFADTDANRVLWASRDAALGPYAKGVVLELEPGAKLAQMWPEEVGFGKFEVIKRLPDEDGVSHLLIRQTSMIEDDVAVSARKAKGGKRSKIPEITLIKAEAVDSVGSIIEDIGGTRLNLTGVDPKAHKGLREGIADYHIRHPGVVISEVAIDPTLASDKSTMARATPFVGRPDSQGWETRVGLSPNWFGEGKYEDLDTAVRRDSRQRWSVPTPDDVDAAYAVFTHEGGHGLDAAGFEQTRKEVNEILMNEFHRLHPEFDMQRLYGEAQRSGIASWTTADGSRHHMTYQEFLDTSPEAKLTEEAAARSYRKFLQDNMSEYSFEKGARNARFLQVRPGEALAEASADVDINGDKATITSKALQRRMVENATPDDSMRDIDLMRLRGGLSKAKDAADTPAKVVAAKEKPRTAKAVAAEKKAADQVAKKAAADAKKADAAAAKAVKDAERQRKKDASNLKNFGTSDPVEVAKAKAALAAEQAEKRKILDDAKAKGYGLVKRRIANGTEIKMVIVNGKPDIAATFAKYSTGEGREVLKENWRQALKGMHGWAKEAGKKWYPELHRLTVRLSEMYGETFEKSFGVKLTPDLVSSFMGAFSENNVWANNLVGVRKFLDGTSGMPERRNMIGMTVGDILHGGVEKFSLDKYEYSERKIKGPWLKYEPDHGGRIEVKKEAYAWVTADGANYDFHIDKALRAVKNPRGGVADLRENASGAPKPADFSANAAGDYSRGTADRWVARIMLHTDDDKVAEALRSYGKTINGVKDPMGYKLMSKILEEVAAEFPELTVAAAQAGPWVDVVGPAGAVAYIEDLTSVSSVNKETLRRVIEFGEVE